MAKTHWAFALGAIAFAFLSAATANAQKLYWNENVQGTYTLRSACMTGLQSRVLDVSQQIRSSIKLDLGQNQIYWLNRFGCWRSRLDGSDLARIILPNGSWSTFDIDTANGALYFADPYGHRIIRTDLGGGNPVDVVNCPSCYPSDPTVDLVHQKLYWLDLGASTIERADLNGANAELVFQRNYILTSLVYDPVQLQLFWLEGTPNALAIWRGRIDGSSPQLTIAVPVWRIGSLALDSLGGKVYWTERSEQRIMRANFDGTVIEDLFSPPMVSCGCYGCCGPGLLAIDPRPCGGPDCQSNGVPDGCDLCNGVSADCDLNDVPDECQPDCDADGTPNDCDPDCNANQQSDVCDIFGGNSKDVLPFSGDGIPDDCQTDCNGNLIPDDVDLAQAFSPDCNGNAVPDECDINVVSIDCNLDGVPDECGPDCNHNQLHDECDISWGYVADCDANGVPDECQVDCNSNSIPDTCDIASGFSQDVDGDGRPNECDPVNDDCDDAMRIFEGTTLFSGFGATPDGPQMCRACGPICEPGPRPPDVWFDHVTPCLGTLEIELRPVEYPAFVSSWVVFGFPVCYPTNLQVYVPSLICSYYELNQALTVNAIANFRIWSLGAAQGQIKLSYTNVVACHCDLSWGDYDGNTKLRLDDFARLASCLSRPESEVCTRCFDFDGGGSIDLKDFAEFQTRFTMP